MSKKSLKIPAELFREAIIETGPSETGKNGEQKISISTDEPYLRYDWYDDEEYWEVLSHAPGDIDETRLKAGLPGLFNHNRNEHLSRATGYENTGHKLYVTGIKWSESDDAQEKKKDVENGVLPDTSVGYQILGEGICVGAKDDKPIYKFRWQPFEFSHVTIPADINCGAGRQRAKESQPNLVEIPLTDKKEFDNSPNTNETQTQSTMNIRPSVRQHFHEADKGGGGGGVAELPKVDEKAIGAKALKAYHETCKQIRAHVAALKPAEWQKAAEKVAAKYYEQDEPSFDAFRSESNNAISELMEKSSGRIEVIGEREEDPTNRDRRSVSKSVGRQFTELKAFKDCGGHLERGRVIALETGINALGARGKANLATRAGFTSGDLSPINVQIQTGIIGLGLERLTIMDMIAPGTTGAAAVIYPQENTFGTVDGVAVDTTSGAGPKAGMVGERGVKPKWEPDLTTVTANVKKVAITADLPDEFVADFPQAQSFLDQRMPYMCDLKTEEQVLYGDGAGNNLKGIFTFAGIQTRAITATDDSTIAASFLQGMTDIRVGSHFEPDGFGFHPYDWETAQLLKDDDKRFLAGGPYYIPLTSGVFVEMRTFWGKPVVVSTSIRYGSPIAGAFKLGAQYFLREGMRIEMSNSNKDNFERNMITARAEHRLAVANYRPPCFLEFTGFPARA